MSFINNKFGRTVLNPNQLQFMQDNLRHREKSDQLKEGLFTINYFHDYAEKFIPIFRSDGALVCAAKGNRTQCGTAGRARFILSHYEKSLGPF